jgi:hypothetical protein
MMTFNHPFSKEVICQFYATVQFDIAENGVYSLTWMTKEHLMKAKWEDLAQGLGYELIAPNNFNTFWVHLAHKPVKKEKMIDLYLVGRAMCGSAYDLLPTYDLMLRVFRNTVNPEKGNLDEFHGFLVKLLVLTHLNKGSGKQLDVMDYIWHEMRDCDFFASFPPLLPTSKCHDGSHGSHRLRWLLEHHHPS